MKKVNVLFASYPQCIKAMFSRIACALRWQFSRKLWKSQLLIGVFLVIFFMGMSAFCFVSFLLDWILFLLLFGLALLGIVWALRSYFPSMKEKSNQKSKEYSLIEVLHEGVLLFDRSGTVLQLNRKAEHFLAVSREKILHSSFFQRKSDMHPMLWSNCSRLMQKCIKRKSLETVSFCLEEQEKQAYDLLAKPLDREGEFALLLRDSSPQYKTQQVGKDFVANASHELRTPITIIKGFAETLRDLPEISEDMLEDFMEKIVRNCQRMDSLVKNLLTLTDLDYLPMSRIQECDLVLLIDNCVHMLLAVRGEAQVETWYNRDIITVFADPDLLELAILNLLENGVKYSSDKPKLKITIEQLPKEVCLSISDSGIGIPQEDLPHIFDRFYTVNKAHARKLGGAGLGLSIVKGIVNKHNATITVDSKLGKGTTFTLTFS